MTDYIVWTDDLIIDSGLVDEDHHRLARLIGELHLAEVQKAGKADIARLMAELIFYTQDHLLREEEIMAAVGFPHLDEHKQGHIRMLRDLRHFQKNHAEGDAMGAHHLSSMLSDWFTNHVRNEDGELRSYLESRSQG